MSVPEAAIEAATEAIHPGGIPLANSRAIARAAIEAAMPAIREALAQEWDAKADTHARGTHPWVNYKTAARIVRGGAA